jgi:hypothetical protein
MEQHLHSFSKRRHWRFFFILTESASCRVLYTFWKVNPAMESPNVSVRNSAISIRGLLLSTSDLKNKLNKGRALWTCARCRFSRCNGDLKITYLGCAQSVIFVGMVRFVPSTGQRSLVLDPPQKAHDGRLFLRKIHFQNKLKDSESASINQIGCFKLAGERISPCVPDSYCTAESMRFRKDYKLISSVRISPPFRNDGGKFWHVDSSQPNPCPGQLKGPVDDVPSGSQSLFFFFVDPADRIRDAGPLPNGSQAVSKYGTCCLWQHYDFM